MRTLELETAIGEFLNTARKIASDPKVTAIAVLNWVAEFYRDTRITGAQLDEDGDMLLLQWGTTTPLIIASPADLRDVSYEEIAFEESEQRYIDFTRQVLVATDDEDSEFDDSAVQLNLTLLFGAAMGDEPSSNLWIQDIDGIENQLDEFQKEHFVQGLLNESPSRIVATVQYCG